MITVSKSDFDRQIVPDDCPDTSYLGTYSAGQKRNGPSTDRNAGIWAQ